MVLIVNGVDYLVEPVAAAVAETGSGRGYGCDDGRKDCIITAFRAGCFKGDGDWDNWV